MHSCHHRYKSQRNAGWRGLKGAGGRRSNPLSRWGVGRLATFRWRMGITVHIPSFLGTYDSEIQNWGPRGQCRGLTPSSRAPHLSRPSPLQPPNPQASGRRGTWNAWLPGQRRTSPLLLPHTPLKENYFKASHDFSCGGPRLVELLPV